MKEARPANIRSFLLTVLILSSSAFQALAYYHPDEGRWINRDPIGKRGGLNNYSFVQNASPNQYDYLGLWGSGGYGWVSSFNTHEMITDQGWNTAAKPTLMMPYYNDVKGWLIRANVAVDGGILADNYYLHFTRPLNGDVPTAIRNYTTELHNRLTRVNNHLSLPFSRTKCEAAMTAQGELLHMVQDYYSHRIAVGSDGSASTIGVITGNPWSPSGQPASWGNHNYFPWTYGEHGGSEPGERAPDTASRVNKAIMDTRGESVGFASRWWDACGCLYAKDIFGH